MIKCRSRILRLFAVSSHIHNSCDSTILCFFSSYSCSFAIFGFVCTILQLFLSCAIRSAFAMWIRQNSSSQFFCTHITVQLTFFLHSPEVCLKNMKCLSGSPIIELLFWTRNRHTLCNNFNFLIWTGHNFCCLCSSWLIGLPEVHFLTTTFSLNFLELSLSLDILNVINFQTASFST